MVGLKIILAIYLLSIIVCGIGKVTLMSLVADETKPKFNILFSTKDILTPVVNSITACLLIVLIIVASIATAVSAEINFSDILNDHILEKYDERFNK